MNRPYTEGFKIMEREQTRMHKEADANNDGVLDLGEWKHFTQLDHDW